MPILIPPAPPAPGARVAVGYGTRTASGNQAITGLGFQPKAVILFAWGQCNTYIMLSWGPDNATTSRGSVYIDGTGARGHTSGDYSIYLWYNATYYARAYVASLDSDGFTLTWTFGVFTGAAFKWIAIG